MRPPGDVGWQWYGGEWKETDGWAEGPLLSHWQSGEKWHLTGAEQEGLEALPVMRTGGALIDWKRGRASWHYEDYRQAVEAAQAAMQAGTLEKVVLSVAWEYPLLSGGMDRLQAWASAAAARHPEALVWLASLGNGIVWGGATPEPLLQSDGRRWQTVALAGTQFEAAAFSGKEHREHDSVVRHIRSRLQAEGVPFDEGETEVVRSGRLFHLRRSFVGQRRGVSGRLITALHPTPAVVGMPVEAAQRFIAEHEPHPRRLYTGLVGRYAEAEPQVWVNLRCFRLDFQEGRATFYAGGGITAESVPAAEWEEIRRKIDTMQRPWRTIG